jgi:hypothetical protein
MNRQTLGPHGGRHSSGGGWRVSLVTGLGFSLAMGLATVSFAEPTPDYDSAITPQANGTNDAADLGSSSVVIRTTGEGTHDYGASASSTRVTGSESPSARAAGIGNDYSQSYYQRGASQSSRTSNHSYSQSDYQPGSGQSRRASDTLYSQADYQPESGQSLQASDALYSQADYQLGARESH